MNKMKDIKDYLHFYSGCYVNTVDGVGVNLGHFYPDVWIKEGNIEPNGILVFFNHISTVYVMNYGQCKLLLRPLSSMTEEEAKECGNLVYDFSDDEELNNWNWKDYQTLLASEQFIWLLSKHFDLFSLIEEGLAIDFRNPNSEPAAQESDTTNDK